MSEPPKNIWQMPLFLSEEGPSLQTLVLVSHTLRVHQPFNILICICTISGRVCQHTQHFLHNIIYKNAWRTIAGLWRIKSRLMGRRRWMDTGPIANHVGNWIYAESPSKMQASLLVAVIKPCEPLTRTPNNKVLFGLRFLVSLTAWKHSGVRSSVWNADSW